MNFFILFAWFFSEKPRLAQQQSAGRPSGCTPNSTLFYFTYFNTECTNDGKLFLHTVQCGRMYHLLFVSGANQTHANMNLTEEPKSFILCAWWNTKAVSCIYTRVADYIPQGDRGMSFLNVLKERFPSVKQCLNSLDKAHWGKENML